MNVETIELNTVKDEAKADATLEVLALSIDDLDLVSGGLFVGAGC